MLGYREEPGLEVDPVAHPALVVHVVVTVAGALVFAPSIRNRASLASPA